MTDGPKARRAPRLHEQVNLMPAVETDAETSGLEHAGDLGEGGPQPFLALVIGDAAARAVMVVDQIRRVRKHEVYAAGRHRRQQAQAIVVDNAIDETVNGV